jgi:hypothetical protein
VIRIRELSRSEHDIQQQQVRLANQLRELLWRYFPQLIKLSPGLMSIARNWPLSLFQAEGGVPITASVRYSAHCVLIAGTLSRATPTLQGQELPVARSEQSGGTPKRSEDRSPNASRA